MMVTVMMTAMVTIMILRIRGNDRPNQNNQRDNGKKIRAHLH